MKRYAKLILSRVSARQPRYFLLRRQKKVSKEKAARMPLESCASRLWRGFSKGPSLALRKRGASLRRPCRAVLAKGCDARRGIRELKPCLRQFSASRFFNKTLSLTSGFRLSLNRTLSAFIQQVLLQSVLSSSPIDRSSTELPCLVYCMAY